jgi:hypothetical protein
MDSSLNEAQYRLQKAMLLLCEKRNTLYQDVQVFIEEHFDIETCSFDNNGMQNEIGAADLICKHLIVCCFLEIPKDKTLALLKEYSDETNVDLHGEDDPRHPNIAELFLGSMEDIHFSKPINELIKIKEK